MKKQAKEQDGNDGVVPAGALGLDKQGMPITDAKEVQAGDIQRKEAAERHEAITEAQFRLN